VLTPVSTVALLVLTRRFESEIASASLSTDLLCLLLALRESIAIIGVHSPRVFNRNDQSLGNSWSVVYFGNREELLPYHGPSRERMAWTLWNDLLLYRNSIRCLFSCSGRDLKARCDAVTADTRSAN
jgi:hypothetical protein